MRYYIFHVRSWSSKCSHSFLLKKEKTSFACFCENSFLIVDSYQLAFQSKAAVINRTYLDKATQTPCNHLQKASSSSSFIYSHNNAVIITRCPRFFKSFFYSTLQKVKRTVYTLRTFLKQAQRRAILA